MCALASALKVVFAKQAELGPLLQVALVPCISFLVSLQALATFLNTLIWSTKMIARSAYVI